MTDFNLEIDPHEVKRKIISSLQQTIKVRDSSGLLVIFSGQLDSYTVAKLSIEAAGFDNVKLLIISDVSKQRREEISSIARKHLHFPMSRIHSFDISEVTSSLEAFIPKLGSVPADYRRNVGNYLLRTQLVQETMKKKTLDVIGKPLSQKDEFILEVVSHSKIRKRLKSLLAYLKAEEENYLLVSKTNKTEWLTGLFTKFGYGHAADIMPIGDLYRSQVYMLAEYLDIPKAVRDRAFTDIIPGVKSKYNYFFDLRSIEVDRILIRLQAGLSSAEVSNDTGLELEKIEQVNHFYQASKFQRAIPIISKID
ncbi:MAG: NAD(+) synthase [Candidatus Hodarchaeales archaeon]|jgi:NAD+ synthase